MKHNYRLGDAARLQREHPNALDIPGEAERTSLLPGDFAKLIFEADVGSRVTAERMWVQVSHKTSDGLYCGHLANTPLHVRNLQLGAPIVFATDNIADIRRAAPQLTFRRPLM